MLFIKHLKNVLAGDASWPCIHPGLTVPCLGASRCLLLQPEAGMSQPRLFSYSAWSGLSIFPAFAPQWFCRLSCPCLPLVPNRSLWTRRSISWAVSSISSQDFRDIITASSPGASVAWILNAWFAKGFRKHKIPSSQLPDCKTPILNMRKWK